MIQHGWVQHINIYRLGLSDGPKKDDEIWLAYLVADGKRTNGVWWWIYRSISHSILLWLKHSETVNNTSLYCETSNWARVSAKLKAILLMNQHINFSVWAHCCITLLRLFGSSFFSTSSSIFAFCTWGEPKHYWIWSLGHLHFFKNNAFGVWCSTEWIGLPTCAQMSFFVILVSPSLVTTVVDVFTCGTKSSWLAWNAKETDYLAIMTFKWKFNKINTIRTNSIDAFECMKCAWKMWGYVYTVDTTKHNNLNKWTDKQLTTQS